MRRITGLAAGVSCVLIVLGSCRDNEVNAPTGPRASPQIPAPGAATQLGLSAAFDPYAFLPFILDDGGPNDNPAQSDLNSFTRADNVAGVMGVAWTWDDINSWTGSGQTGDACALFDTDTPANGFADYAVCVRITNNADGSQVLQLPAGQSPQIYGCSDKKTDRCSQPNPPPLPLKNTFCEVVKTAESFPAQGDDGQDVLAACAIDLSAIGNATKANILNVCSFPSGAPNSNAFDCVVTPGAGFLRIVKKTTPDQSGKTFSFTLNPAATSGTTSFSLTDTGAGNESSALIAVLPGKYALSEGSLPTGWILDKASCVAGNGSATGTKNGNTVSNIDASIGETTVCTFENIAGAPTLSVTKTANPTQLAETGGSVTYTVDVQNTTVVPVTLTSLSDDKFGDLNGKGSCATGGTIAAGATYSCSFAQTLAPSTAGTTHKNTVTATVSNAGGTATATNDATVTYTDVAPTVTVTKTASPTTLPETGGTVTYTVEVKNDAAEAVTLTALSDDKFGALNGQGTCATGGSIAAGGTYSCTFSKTVSGNANTSHVNTVTATVQDDDGSSASDTDDATVTFSNVAPTITVAKTPNPASVPETGGSVTYTVQVTNNAAEPVTLTALSDDKFGNLNGQGTCATGGSIAAGGSYSCTFSKTIAGNAGSTHTNTATATVQDNDGSSASGSDDATVTFSDVAPTVTVLKTANPTSVSEAGGNVTYTVQVTNNSAEAVTLTTLSDDKFGNLNGQGSCATGASIAAGGSYSCTFTKALSGNAGTSHVNVVTGTVTDDDGSTGTDTDDATVTFTNVEPTVTVTKTASPASVPETGGSVSYAVQVTNSSSEAVTLTTLSDDKFGNLNGQGTCATGGSIAAGATYSCSFSKTVSGNAGTSHVNTVTATVEDNDGSSASDTDDATVTFSDVLPNMSVTKTASPTSLVLSGGGGLGNFTPDRTFTSNGTPPNPGSFQFFSPTCDDAGPNDQPAQVDLNCFNRADNVSGKLGVKWTWDDINSWTGTGQTGDGCALLDTDNDGNANVAICARITNTPDGLQVVQVPNAGAADVYLCNDTKPDRCAKQVTKLANILTTTCTVAKVADAFPGQGDDNADVEATCSIDLSMQGLIGVTSIDLLNVCSFPSGEPNSNPFDCVVSVGAGFIQIVKVANPATTELFGFTMSPASTDGSSKYAVQGGVTTSLIPVAPGNNYSLVETMPASWSLSGVACTVDGASTGTANVAQNRITGILVKTGQTTVCTFTNTALVSGNVTYTIVVTNNGLEALTLDSLNDDKFGNLNGVGSCQAGGSIAGSASYTCTFTKTLTGAPGTQHTNTVTAVGKDNDGNSTTKQASATVSFLGSP